MVRDVCLAVDLGTGGLKVGLVDFDGSVIALTMRVLTTTFGSDGSAVQDAQQWWELIVDSAHQLFAEYPSAQARVAAVAVTGQWASTVPVDVRGEPTGPCLTWQDTRGGLYVRERLGGRVSGYAARHLIRWVRTTGGVPSMSGADPVGHLLAFATAYPHAVDATRWFLEPVDYLTMRFTGVASATHASMQAAWLTDTRRLGHYAYDEGLLAVLGLDADKLAPLRPIGSVIDTVRPDVARELGIGTEVVVLTGLPDLQAAALGAGATSLYATHLALSTTSWISCPVPAKKTDVRHSIAAVPGLTNDSYLVANNQETGAKSLDWLRSMLAGAGTLLDYDDLTALAAGAPPGAHGVRFSPWLAGERSPVENLGARGGFTNLAVTSDTADLARAVLEGVAANSHWLFSHVETFCGRRLSSVRIVGGGARSSLWCQIFADAFNRPVERVTDPMFAQLRGMASLAAVTLEQRSLGDLDGARDVERVFEPSRDGVEAMAAVNDTLGDLFRTSAAWSRRR